MNRKASLVITGALVAVMLASVAWGEAPEAQESAAKENLTDTQRLSKSSEYLTQMRQVLKIVFVKLEEARASKDVVKLNCVNEKLTNIKGLLRISEQADIALQEAVAKHESQSAEHEYTKVAIAHQKVEQLKAEGEQCVGMLAYETGPTEVIVQEPTNLSQTESTMATSPTSIVSRPIPASPFH